MKVRERKLLINQAEQILDPVSDWARNCHAASLQIVRELGGRVARGWCEGVSSQHSWAVIGNDCYDPKALIIDPTLWSYDNAVKGVWSGTLRDGRHHPHGAGSIWEFGRPAYPTGEIVSLTPKKALSVKALRFLKRLGPLDRAGWHILASRAPVGGWPAGEILAAVDDTKALSALVPVDRLGMLTDRNPGKLYLGKPVNL